MTKKTLKSGSIEGIYIAPEEGADTVSRSKVRAVPGMGLEGDRNYIKQKGRPPEKRKPHKELTLIESENIERLMQDGEFAEIQPGELRRNIITRDVPLNELVGKTIEVGEVEVEGLELCEPCRHLEKLTGKKVMKPLIHRGGLRCRILSEGIIRLEDRISY